MREIVLLAAVVVFLIIGYVIIGRIGEFLDENLCSNEQDDDKMNRESERRPDDGT
ncbi:MAG: hypothetical protein ACI4DV_07995 [Lachnospiraceae bacterium]